MLLRSTLALLFINKCIASASAPSPPQPTSPAPDEQQTYLHFPHPETRQGTAFLPRDATDASPDLEGIEWSKIPIADPDKVMNPAPAWMRHPLAPRVPLDVSRQPAPKKRRADGGEEEAQEELLPGEGVWRDRKHKRDVITESEAPYPPAAYIDVNNLTTIALVAQAAAARMQTWYEDGLYEWTQWWQTPVIGMAYANLDLAFGNSGNELLVRDLLIKNDGLGWMIDKYIDDQSWWAMFALRAYQAYPNETWLGMVEAIVQNDTLYWDDTCGGGILWLTYRQQYKNTITNGLYFSSLARLYRWTGNYTYFQYSMNTLNWWLEWGFETSTGRVYDTITAPDCNVTGLQSWTYNSGAFLYGLADLYYATGNTSLLDLGRSIAYAAIRDFSYEDVGVLYESCEDDPQPSADLPPGCQSDEVAFKGVLMMGMAELYLARPDSNLYNYINTQLLSNVFNNLDESWLFGEWWQGPWNETTAGPKTQITALAMLSAAALVNADYLSKVSGGNTVMTGIATDQVAFPNNATLTGNSAGSTQRSSLNSDASSLRWNAGPAIVLAALGVTTGALSTLPGKHSYSVQVVRSSPRRSHALFPHASNQSTKIWQEEVLVLLSEAITTTDAAASTPTTRALPISAIEASIYTIPSTSTSLVYISKVDTTGLSKSAPSPTRPLVAAFVAHLLEHPPHATRRVRIHIFARAQGQYLFPGSVDNKGKRVLDDKGLIRWWKGTISKAINSIPPSTSEPTTPTQLFYLVPGLSYTESLPYVPATPSPTWIYSHPYSQISSPLHLPSASSSPGPLHDHIPNFPDDPKSRFITSLTSSPIPPAGSPDDYDEVIHALHQRSFTSGSSSTLAASLEALEKERARERTRLVDGIPGGVEEYWERLAFRQECCSGQLVGFFVVVRDAPVDPLTIVKGQPKPESMAVEHAVFTRLWSQFHNSDYSEPAVGTLEPAARKWERDVEAITSGEGWVGEPAAEKEDEDEEKIRLKELRAKGYKDEVKRVVDVDNPVAPGGEKRPLEEKPEEKKVNVMVPRKKKKAT